MLRNLFYIVKHDRQTLLCLFVVFLATIVLFFGGDSQPPTAITSADSSSQAVALQRSPKSEGGYAVKGKTVRLTSFDPNTADSTQLLALGLTPWQVRNIYRYRAAGGVYTCPEDFAQLYGLTVKKYRELLPYIRISDDYRMAADVYKRPSRHYGSHAGANQRSSFSQTTGGDSSATTAAAQRRVSQNAEMYYPSKLKPGETISLNASDTMALRRVPGIGPYFARKIARYRTRLGGFVSCDQLLEIQDFPESALPYFAVESDAVSSVRRININTATSEELRQHPYISFLMARQIMDYRRLRGKVADLNDFRLLPTFTEDVIRKLRPYIEY